MQNMATTIMPGRGCLLPLRRVRSIVGPTNLYICYISILLFLASSSMLLHSCSSYTRGDRAEVSSPLHPTDTYTALMGKSKNESWSKNIMKRIEKLYQAVVTLVEELPDELIYPKELLSHMSVLRTRVFTDEIRQSRCNGCMAWKYTTLKTPQIACKDDYTIANQRTGSPYSKNTVRLLALITTIPSEVEERNAVRKTWGSVINYGNIGILNIVFLFGGGWEGKEQEIINKEYEEFGDILQANFTDNYYNLDLKVLMGMIWANQNCKKVDFILRTGCDNFINIPGVFTLISKNKAIFKSGGIGLKVSKLPPSRMINSKWFLSARDISDRFLPDFPVGTAFLYSMSSVNVLVDVSPNIPHFPLEDTYFGYCMQAVGMPTINVKGFNMFLPNEWVTSVEQKGVIFDTKCPFQPPWYNVHYVDPNYMRIMWDLCVVKNQHNIFPNVHEN